MTPCAAVTDERPRPHPQGRASRGVLFLHVQQPPLALDLPTEPAHGEPSPENRFSRPIALARRCAASRRAAALRRRERSHGRGDILSMPTRAVPPSARRLALSIAAAIGVLLGAWGPPLRAQDRPGSGLADPDRADRADPADLDALWREACLWEVGSNAAKVPAARRALIATGSRALDYLIPAKLDTKDTLVTRALQVVIKGIGADAAARLLPCLDSPESNVRRNAADLLGVLGAVEAAPAIARLLDDPDARLGALTALAALRAQESAPAVERLMGSDAPERVRCAAAAALGAIGGPAAGQALGRALEASPAPLRFAAQFALEAMRAIPTLRSRLESPEIRVRLHAIAALGRIGDPAAREDLLPRLRDPDPAVRGFAAEALATMLRESDRETLRAAFTVETDPFARGKLEVALAH